MARVDHLLSDLEVLGNRRDQARRDAAEAMAAIRKTARAAHKAGATKTAIAQAAKVSRPALDELLR